MVTMENFLGPFCPIKSARFELFQVESERFCHGVSVGRAYPGTQANPSVEKSGKEVTLRYPKNAQRIARGYSRSLVA